MDDVNVKTTPDHEGLADIIKANSKAEIIDIVAGSKEKAHVLIVPKGKEVVSVGKYLDEYLEKPKRRKGVAEVTRLSSFIDLTNRFKASHSVIFGQARLNGNSLDAKLKTIFNYHPEGPENESAEYMDHSVQFKFPLSKDFQYWLGNNAKAMSTNDFSIFMEERIVEMVVASDEDKQPIQSLKPKFADPLEMLELSRDLQIHSEDTVVSKQKLSSGEHEIKFSTEHKDSSGQKIQLPDFFVINVPIFEGGDTHRICVRLRYRLNSGSIAWFYDLYRIDNVLNDAFDHACACVVDKTKLPLFYGQNEQ